MRPCYFYQSRFKAYDLSMDYGEISTYAVRGGFHAHDSSRKLTTFGRTQEAAVAELRRLQALSDRLAVEFAAAPKWDQTYGRA